MTMFTLDGPPAPARGRGAPTSPAGAPTPAAPARSAFRAAVAAAGVSQGHAPPRTVTLPASAWATAYADRPAGDVEVGLRLYAEAEAVQARAAAGQRAWRLHPERDDEEERVAAGDGALMAWLVARCTCKPDDTRRPFFGGELGGAEDLVPLALTPKGVEFLFDALNRLLLEESPTAPEADDEDLAWLAEALAGEDLWSGLGRLDVRRVRRLLGAAIELMGGRGEG